MFLNIHTVKWGVCACVRVCTRKENFDKEEKGEIDFVR